MKLTKLTAQEASNVALEILGMDADAIGISWPEGLATSLRRAASFLCPSSPARLLDAVFEALQPLLGDGLTRDDLTDLLHQLVAEGDLLELRKGTDASTRLLYLAPPSYVERVPGVYLLMGVRPFGVPLIEDDLARAIEYEGQTRILTIDPDEAEVELRSRGLRRISKRQWVSSPSKEEPEDLIERYRTLLSVAPKAGHLEGLILLDPVSKVSYYKGRWRSANATDTGDFVARRPQEYGADLWCLVRFDAGAPHRLLEFPVNDPAVPARDEAWRYQAAIDALRGKPQQFRLRRSSHHEAHVIVDFFSPLPGFVERYVQFTGLALGKTSGALYSFRLPADAVDDVTAFLTEMLWMTPRENNSGD